MAMLNNQSVNQLENEPFSIAMLDIVKLPGIKTTS